MGHKLPRGCRDGSTVAWVCSWWGPLLAPVVDLVAVEDIGVAKVVGTSKEVVFLLGFGLAVPQ